VNRIIRSLRTGSFAASMLLCILPLLAQSDKGAISGHVTDEGGAILQGACVTLDPIDRTTVTDMNGNFTIANLPAGTYAAKISYVGFSSYRAEIKVQAGKAEQVQAALRVAGKNEEVVVVAERVHGEAEAINRIKTGDNILQIVTSEVITSLPNANMAEAIGRLPSVTLDRDEGEGAYIQVRGTEPRLTNITINGNTIPSEEGGVRQVRLDAVPSDLVESAELNKTLSANQDADGIGGSVNFVTKTADEKPTFVLSGLGGYSPIAQGRQVSQMGATLGKRFGATKKLGLLIGGTYDFNGRGFDDLEPAFAAGSTTYGDLQTRQYLYDRTRYGLTWSADYKVNHNSSLYMKGMYSKFDDFGDKWYYDYIQASAPKFYTSKKSPVYAVSTVSMGGKHFFGASSLHWDLGASYSWEDAAAGNPKADFSWLPATGLASKISYTIDQTTNPKRPKFTPVNATLDQIFTPSNWVLVDAYTSTGRSGALSLSSSVDYSRVHKFGSRYGEFSVGAKMRNVHRGQNAVQNIYDLNGTGAKPSSSIASTYRMTNFLSSFTNPDYYDGAYKFGPVTDFQNIIDTAVKSASPLLKLDVAKTLSKTATANYNLVERIGAGYLMDSVDLTKRLHLQVGLRFENTYEDGSGFKYVSGATQTTKTDPVEHSYLDVLPSAQLRFSPTSKDNLRLVYSRGIARPNPLQLIPYINETDGTTTCPTGYTCVGSIVAGNPDLVAEHANNYDVLYERFLKPMGMIQIGFFYKDLSKPLFTTQTVMEYLGADYAATKPVNGTDAHLAGVEVGYQQHLSFLPGVLSGLGLNANYSYTSSEAHGIPYTSSATTSYRTAALLRQAPHTWNIGPTYDRGRASFRAGVSYNSQNIYQYANVDPNTTVLTSSAKGPAGDTFVYGHTQVDVQGTVRLYKGLHFMAYGQNLTNAPFGFYNGDPKYMIQREYYKPTYSGGLRYTFSAGER
jgi:TonB-dependent receptor